MSSPAEPTAPLGTPAAGRPSVPVPAFDVVALGASLGGMQALGRVLGALPADFPAPVVIVQHLSPRFPSLLDTLLGQRSALPVVWARPAQPLRPGIVYLAPPDRHLLIGPRGVARLWAGAPVQFSRPSVDVLFASVARTYRERALAVVLTGMCSDGADGARAIKRAGGRVLAQDAASSAAFGMPRAAISTGCVDFVLPLPTISPALIALTMAPGAAALLRTPRAGGGCAPTPHAASAVMACGRLGAPGILDT